MKVFLVRHAESTANVLNILGGAEVELSENGIRQAEMVAKRFSGVEVDLILCSRFRRAVHTARIINGALKTRIAHTDLLGEWMWPSELKMGEPSSERIWDRIYENAHDPGWHYSDEENISEITNRAQKLLDYLKARKEKSIVVVTHGALMGVLLGLVFFGKGMTSGELRRATKFFVSVNTGITELEITKQTARMITFNDYAHLK
jgi:probable phosphoglycerate mutase